MRSRVVSLLGLGLIVVATAGAAAGSASAAPVDLVCPFAGTITAAPGASLLPQAQQIGGTVALGTSVSPLTPCSSVLTGVPYTGGVATVSGAGNFGCLPLGIASVAATLQLTWNNGDTSQISASVTVVGPVPVVMANVTGGALQGSTLAFAPVPTGLTGNCVLAPGTALSFAGLTTFLAL